MKQKRALILFLALALVLIAAGLLIMARSTDADLWNGDRILATTTPTLTLLPEGGWWNQPPTLEGRFSPFPSPTP